ncbi:hypothetical protein B7P43_G09972 [Cryptotermes secundus]|uniref:Peptidase S1 domain-containing protein n=1 Tax=Cryptotermes secundus TaxID=105785 RepID=A0A2J7PUH3_9NEOP|nr:hypothetical protein B7P43_G09972 [Cryptotermes secundus]
MKLFLAVFSTLVLGCLGAHSKIQGVFVDLARNLKIVNGEKAEDGEFPFQVSLQYAGRHYCGATLLSTEYILTAAHCIFGNLVGDYSVRAGSNANYEGGTVHRVVEWAYHEDYINEAYWYNDIAVLKVNPNFTLTENLTLTKLPPDGDEPEDGAASVAIGWGSTCYGCAGQTNLQKVNLRIFSHEDCLEAYGDGPTRDMVCSGVPEDTKGVCSVLLLNPNTTAQCTGTRIFPQWFLTAANCNPSGTKDFIVISRNNNNGQYDNHTITKWINHNEYNNNKYWNNNIALVKVEPIIEGPYTAVLPNADVADYTNETGTVFGWGANCGFCSWSETLKKIDNLKIYSHEECEAIYGEGPTNSTICAGNPDKLEGICDNELDLVKTMEEEDNYDAHSQNEVGLMRTLKEEEQPAHFKNEGNSVRNSAMRAEEQRLRFQQLEYIMPLKV